MLFICRHCGHISSINEMVLPEKVTCIDCAMRSYCDCSGPAEVCPDYDPYLLCPQCRSRCGFDKVGDDE